MSNVLGVVDGVVDFPMEVKFINVNNNGVFEDDLQDLFLEIIEED